MVQNALLFFDEKRYKLHAWVIMPNHVHVLVHVFDGFPVAGTVQSWKGFSAREANKLLGRQGAFWQRDYYDRYIRDDDHYCDAVEYIHNNPVKAGLVKIREDWEFSSVSVRNAAWKGSAPRE
jgi:REP element-mobilizing transposase RayT